eukprot:gb/GFBE01064697.1/.p1 GENE.gb/GFBE01064697.1/~~gb/GFBE01064697.1/.p1  ORF type:complete len:317 (+),score=47.45 gb/GFBE01064697.1/:1-951(+)
MLSCRAMKSAPAVDAKAGAGLRRTCCSRLPWFFCPAFALVASLIFLLLGIWSLHLRARFTPLYDTIRCAVGQPNLDSFDGRDLSISVEVTCDNPNPYAITVETAKQGKVYMGASRTEVGSLTQIPRIILGAEGSGSITAKTDMTLSGSLIGELIPALVGDVPVYMDLDLTLRVDVSFLLGHFETSLLFQKDCGMYLVGVLGLIANPKAARVGPMACADRGEAVAIPPADSDTSDGEVPFTALNMDPDRIETAKRVKDESLTASIAISFSLFALFLVLGSGCILRRRFCSRSSEANDDALPSNAVTLGKPDAREVEV